MKYNLTVVAAALILGVSSASAAVTVSVTLDGVTATNAGSYVYPSTDDIEFQTVEYVKLPTSVAPLSSVTETFNYTINIHNDGYAIQGFLLPVCTSDHSPTCGPFPNGFEQAKVNIRFYADGRNGGDMFSTVTGSAPQTYSVTTAGDFIFNGTFTSTLTGTDPFSYGTSNGSAEISVWTMAALAAPAAVAEPANVTLLLTGLALIGARVVRRTRAAQS